MRNMTLAEAMRLGAMQTPQAFEDYANHNGGTCALGAAMIGSGACTMHQLLNLTGDEEDGLIAVYPILTGQRVVCPHPDCKSFHYSSIEKRMVDCVMAGHLSQIIAHLNDAHRWTRPQIADWLEAQGYSPVEVIAESIAEPVTA